jgi:hypothetical protein
MNDTLSRLGVVATAAASALLVIDLFLDWSHVQVGAVVVRVSVDSSGLSGWGVAAGIFAVALLVYSLLELSGHVPLGVNGEELVPVALALGVLFTTIARFAGAAHVDVGNVVGVSVERRWPATAGLVLAILIVLAAGARLLASSRPARRGHRLSLNR